MAKTSPSDSAKNVRGDSATFTEFMRKLVAVPQSEMKAKMEEWREINEPTASQVRATPL